MNWADTILEFCLGLSKKYWNAFCLIYKLGVWATGNELQLAGARSPGVVGDHLENIRLLAP